MIPSGDPFAALLWEAENQPDACSWYIQNSQAAGCAQDLGFFWGFSALLCVGQTTIPGSFGIILWVEGCYSPCTP